MGSLGHWERRRRRVGRCAPAASGAEQRLHPCARAYSALYGAQGPLGGGIDVGGGDEVGAEQVGDFLGVDAVVLVLAAVNGLEVEGVGQDEGEASGLAGIGQPIPAEHALGADGQVVTVRGHELEEIGEVVVFDVGVDELLPSRSMRQTYICRAWRSIPQLNSVVDV